ncbi:MAG: ATP-dependent sacrificial sulfur transferase LarE [Acidimicrobiales bacterium]
MREIESVVAALERRLDNALRDIGSMVIAFSGGVDSALVVAAAGRLANPANLAVTADSASLATGELHDCEALAQQLGVAWQPAHTTELDDERYIKNDTDRCYWCKTALMDQLAPIAARRNATVVLGVNLDDLGEHRPGQNAASERGARFPLVEAGFTKADVRRLANAWDVPVWDRPSMPCLASRVPYGTAVSIPLLSRIDRAEAALKKLGLRDVRVRHYDDTARIEVPAADIATVAEHADYIHTTLAAIGYRYVTLDLAGLRSGNLNHVLADPQRSHEAVRTDNPTQDLTDEASPAGV